MVVGLRVGTSSPGLTGQIDRSNSGNGPICRRLGALEGRLAARETEDLDKSDSCHGQCP